LKNKLAQEIIPKKLKETKEIKDKYGEKIIGTCTVSQVNQATGQLVEICSSLSS
jgi:hypothetical protein